MKLLILAWRNVFRHTRRSIISAIAISVGLAAMIFMNSMMNGVDKMAEENIINYEAGALSLFRKGYYREEGRYALDSLIENSDSLIKELRQIKGISTLTERIKFMAQLNTGIDELTVLGIGINVKDDDKVFKIRKSVVKGTFLKTTDDLLIGEGLARELNLDLGAMVTIIVKDKYGTYNAYDFEICGIINTAHPLIDRNTVLIALEIAQELLNMNQQVTEIAIKTNVKDLEKLKKEIYQKIGTRYELKTWKELYASIFEVSVMKRTTQFMLALVVLIIAVVGIVNTMLMAVMERVNEIGTLKAMGYSNFHITKIFVYEGGIIGLGGSLIGSIVGVIMSLYLQYFGFDLSKMFEGIDIIYPIKFILKGRLEVGMVIFTFLFGIIISVLVTLYPVRRAIKLKPIEALRKV
ncbi:MAG: FtsX-like permease family protein [candidate division WOR-3 bacterium]